MVDPWIYGFTIGELFDSVFTLLGNSTHIYIGYQVMNNSVADIGSTSAESFNVMSTSVM